VKVLLYSGGMDTYIAARLPEYKYDLLLYIHTYSRYDDCQLATIMQDRPVNLVIERGKLCFKDMEVEGDNTATVPGRNAYFVLRAADYITTDEPSEIHLCATANSKHTDKTPAFFEAMTKLVNIIHPHKHIVVTSPFLFTGKHEIIWRAICEASMTPEELRQQTFSCYNPGEDDYECGVCPACERKAASLAYAEEIYKHKDKNLMARSQR